MNDTLAQQFTGLPRGKKKTPPAVAPDATDTRGGRIAALGVTAARQSATADLLRRDEDYRTAGRGTRSETDAGTGAATGPGSFDDLATRQRAVADSASDTRALIRGLLNLHGHD